MIPNLERPASKSMEVSEVIYQIMRDNGSNGDKFFRIEEYMRREAHEMWAEYLEKLYEDAEKNPELTDFITSALDLNSFLKFFKTYKIKYVPPVRPGWDEYFLSIAKVVSTRSTCLRANYGAVIVNKDRQIISTGYNGAPAHSISCFDKGDCYRETNNIPSRTRYETCYSVHAEANAIIRSAHSVKNCDIYIDGNVPDRSPCFLCKRMIVNAGIDLVVYRTMDDKEIVKVEASSYIYKTLEELKV